ncbi:MAG: hypothetical protein KKE46_06305, partial [Gammaproteobacteria bacterium]|nr:hypothetical protein [Gammaproteobacteria bacterium]
RLLELMGGNSDNKEFESIGIPAVLFIEDSNFGLDKNPYMNSSNDIPKNIDFDNFFPKAVRAILISVASLAKIKR